jgi:N-acetylmuramoyl-L-alanine amidase
MKLYVIAGHSKTSPGAIAYNGKTEHEYTQEMQRLIVERCPDKWDVVTDNEDESLTDIVSRIGREGVGIDIHFNNNNITATGIEVFISNKSHEVTKDVASKLVMGISRASGFRVRRMFADRDYKFSHESNRGKLAIVDNTKIPFILIEVCFLNKKDLAVYEEKKNDIADAIVRAIGRMSLGDNDPKEEHRV